MAKGQLLQIITFPYGLVVIDVLLSVIRWSTEGQQPTEMGRTQPKKPDMLKALKCLCDNE